MNLNILKSDFLLCEKMVGIIGYGYVGQVVVQCFLDFGVKDLLYNDFCVVKNLQLCVEFMNFE